MNKYEAQAKVIALFMMIAAAIMICIHDPQ